MDATWPGETGLCAACACAGYLISGSSAVPFAAGAFVSVALQTYIPVLRAQVLSCVVLAAAVLERLGKTLNCGAPQGNDIEMRNWTNDEALSATGTPSDELEEPEDEGGEGNEARESSMLRSESVTAHRRVQPPSFGSGVSDPD